MTEFLNVITILSALATFVFLVSLALLIILKIVETVLEMKRSNHDRF